MIELNPAHSQVNQIYHNLLPPVHLPQPPAVPHFVNASTIASMQPPNNRDAVRQGNENPFISAMTFLFNVITYPFAVIYYTVSYAFTFVVNFVKNWLRDGSFSGIEFIPPEPIQQVVPNFSLPAPHLSAEIQTIAAGYRVNIPKIQQAPDQLDLQAIVREFQATGPVLLPEILTHFDALFTGRTEYNGSTVFSNQPLWAFGQLRMESPSMKSNIEKYVNFITNQEQIPGVTSPAYFDNIKIMFQAIIFKLRSPAISNDKKRQVLYELSQGYACAPRRYTEVERQFRYIYDRQETAASILRRWFMEYKQELILERFQRSEFHVISEAIARVGAKWGLTDGVSLGESDPFRRLGHSCNPEHFQRILQEGCVPGRIIHFIETKMDIDRAPNGAPIREEHVIDFWRTAVGEAHAANLLSDEDAYGAVYPRPNLPLTPKGIAFMLNKAGFLDIA